MLLTWFLLKQQWQNEVRWFIKKINKNWCVKIWKEDAPNWCHKNPTEWNEMFYKNLPNWYQTFTFTKRGSVLLFTLQMNTVWLDSNSQVFNQWA